MCVCTPCVPIIFLLILLFVLILFLFFYVSLSRSPCVSVAADKARAERREYPNNNNNNCLQHVFVGRAGARLMEPVFDASRRVPSPSSDREKNEKCISTARRQGPSLQRSAAKHFRFFYLRGRTTREPAAARARGTRRNPTATRSKIADRPRGPRAAVDIVIVIFISFFLFYCTQYARYVNNYYCY